MQILICFLFLQCYLELRVELQLLQVLPQCSRQYTISITTVLPPLPLLFSLLHLHLLQAHMCIHQQESSVKQSDRDILSFLLSSCSLSCPSSTQVDDHIKNFTSITAWLSTTVVLKLSRTVDILFLFRHI